MSTFWNTTSYGWSPVYWIQVTGIPVIFSERNLGKARPTGWTSEDGGSLVIDESAEVGVEQIDRERGIGLGLSFSFKLLDTSTVRDWMRKWSYSATLTADLAYNDTTATVDSTSGWPSSGAFFVGLERVTYTGTTATTFTGLTRGTCGTIAQEHRTGTTDQIVTDRPRYLRGRDVILWASAADPSGYVCGTALDSSEAVQLWRGRIEAPPERHIDGFQFQAKSLDRVLEDPLGSNVTGDVVGTSNLYPVEVGWTLTVQLLGETTAPVTYPLDVTVQVAPFEAYSPGDYLSAEDMRTAISDAFAAAVTDLALTAQLGDLIWKPDGKGNFRAQVLVDQDATVVKVQPTVYLGGKLIEGSKASTYSGGMDADEYVDLGWVTAGNPCVPTSKADKPGVPTSITVRLTEGTTADVPNAGVVLVRSGDATCGYTYEAKGTSNLDLYLTGLKPLQGQKALTAAQLGQADDGEPEATCEIQFVSQGTLDEITLACLESSGTGALGAYDTLFRGQGYGIPDDLIQEGTFESLLGEAPVGSIELRASAAGQSFVDMFSGCLGLFRYAVVCRPIPWETNTPVRLVCVPTAAGSNYETTITNADLLSHNGDPVVSVRRMDNPNILNVTRQPAGQEWEDHLIFQNVPGIDAEGRRETNYIIPATDRAALQVAGLAAKAGHFAYDSTVQAVELLVHPSTLVEVGDVVWLDQLDHPALWTYSTNPGQQGYDGPGRCVGKKMNLMTLVTTLTLLIDGSLRVHSLSPSAVIQNEDNAAAPSWVDLDYKYLKHFEAAVAAGGTVQVCHYQPGEVESSGQRYTVTAVSTVGGNCRLTLDTGAQFGAFSIDHTKASSVTLPPTSLATDYQKQLAHTDDGSQWG